MKKDLLNSPTDGHKLWGSSATTRASLPAPRSTSAPAKSNCGCNSSQSINRSARSAPRSSLMPPSAAAATPYNSTPIPVASTAANRLPTPVAATSYNSASVSTASARLPTAATATSYNNALSAPIKPSSVAT